MAAVGGDHQPDAPDSATSGLTESLLPPSVPAPPPHTNPSSGPRSVVTRNRGAASRGTAEVSNDSSIELVNVNQTDHSDTRPRAGTVAASPARGTRKRSATLGVQIFDEDCGTTLFAQRQSFHGSFSNSSFTQHAHADAAAITVDDRDAPVGDAATLYDVPKPAEFNAGLLGLSHVPDDVLHIAKLMHDLDESKFLILADLTQKRAYRSVYSLLEYRGSSWYLPALRPVDHEAGEKSCGIGFERTSGLWLAACGWRFEIPVLGYVARLALLMALWLLLWSLLPAEHVELNGPVFDPLVAILFCSIVGGVLSRLLRVPPLVSVLAMGVFWNNVPSVGYFTKGITDDVRKASTTVGLTVILIRAGLYLKPEELRPLAKIVAAFAILPAAAELVAHSLMAKLMFSYPSFTWAFTHGAMASVVSPAVVVPAVLTLKLDGYGLEVGPSSLMMAAVPIEMVAAIWNINFMTHLALPEEGKPLWREILTGPLEIIGGIALGAVLGALHFGALKLFLAEAHKLPHRNYTVEHMNRVAWLSTTMLVVVGAAALAYSKRLHLSGGGAVSVTVMAMISSALQRRRGDTVYFAEQFKQLSLKTADLWDVITMPVLFSLVGCSIDVAVEFEIHFFPAMLACVAVGLAARMLMTQIVTSREDYTRGERVAMAFGWCGKASVQAALGHAVIDRVEDMREDILEHGGPEELARLLAIATRIANVGILMIIVCAPIASIVLVRFGPRLIRRDG